MLEINPDFLVSVLLSYGTNPQLGTLAEECNEFSQSFLKYLFRSNKKENWNHMIEEFADLLIMVEQAKHIFDVKLVDEIMKAKLRRLEHRLKDSGHNPPEPFKEVV